MHPYLVFSVEEQAADDPCSGVHCGLFLTEGCEEPEAFLSSRISQQKGTEEIPSMKASDHRGHGYRLESLPYRRV